MKSYQLVICGGGSTYTLPMIKTLCDFKDVFPLKSIVLFDVDPDKQHMVYEATKVMVDELIGGVEVTESYDLNTAFAGADFVFMQIRAGGLKMPGSRTRRSPCATAASVRRPAAPAVSPTACAAFPRWWRSSRRCGDRAPRLGHQLLQPRGHRGGGHQAVLPQRPAADQPL